MHAYKRDHQYRWYHHIAERYRSPLVELPQTRSSGRLGTNERRLKSQDSPGNKSPRYIRPAGVNHAQEEGNFPFPSIVNSHGFAPLAASLPLAASCDMPWHTSRAHSLQWDWFRASEFCSRVLSHTLWLLCSSTTGLVWARRANPQLSRSCRRCMTAFRHPIHIPAVQHCVYTDYAQPEALPCQASDGAFLPGNLFNERNW